MSILIGSALYILIQVAFIGAMPTGCSSRSTAGRTGPDEHQPRVVVALNAGPFFTLASVVGISWLATCCGSTPSSPRAAPASCT